MSTTLVRPAPAPAGRLLTAGPGAPGVLGGGRTTGGTARLARLVTEIAARPSLWRPLVRFSDAERWWTRLDGPADVDVWLLTWTRAQGTELHDHGPSCAGFAVVQGTLTEVRHDPARGLVPQALSAGQVQTVQRGVVHDVLNEHEAPAVSIHAYSPRLAAMTFYDVAGDALVARRTVATSEPEAQA